MTNNANITVTEDQIFALLEEAAEAGDLDQVGLCQRAIEAGPDDIAWIKCERVIAAAIAQMDDE